MSLDIAKITKAHDLPDEWDRLAVDYFQTRQFLDHTEKYNPCKQRYYTLFFDGSLKAASIVYNLKLDLFTFLSIPSPIQMKIIGIPCSVSSSGLIGTSKFLPNLIEYIKTKEKGFLIFLNLKSPINVSSMVWGRTLPTIILKNRFHSWEKYIQSLKAHYRRRVKHISRLFNGIEVRREECSQFNREMYSFYLEVLRRSKGKLETLSLLFFQNLPSNFSLTSYYYKENLLGWYISTIYGKKYYFFLGGIDYKMNRRFNTYFNILLGILREGIEKNAYVIDLGQTAEIPKTRLGGEIVEKVMLGHHSNWLIKKFLNAAKGLLEYSYTVPKTHVFKKTI